MYQTSGCEQLGSSPLIRWVTQRHPSVPPDPIESNESTTKFRSSESTHLVPSVRVSTAWMFLLDFLQCPAEKQMNQGKRQVSHRCNTDRRIHTVVETSCKLNHTSRCARRNVMYSICSRGIHSHISRILSLSRTHTSQVCTRQT